MDDIILVSDVEQAQELLTREERECAKVGLRINARKTKVISCNILPDHPPLMTTGDTALREVSGHEGVPHQRVWTYCTKARYRSRKYWQGRQMHGGSR